MLQLQLFILVFITINQQIIIYCQQNKLKNDSKRVVRFLNFFKNSKSKNINLIDVYNATLELKNILLKDIESRNLIEEEQNLLKQCVNFINRREFDKAENILELFSDEKIFDIVADVYKYDSSFYSFDKVLEFAKNISNLYLRFSIFKALNKQMELSGDTDINHLYEYVIAVSFDEGIASQNSNEITFSQTRNFIKLMINKLKLATIKYLKNSLIYLEDTSVNYITEKIFFYDNQLYQQIYKEFINEMYITQDVSLSDLIKFTYRHGFIETIITGFHSIMDIVERYNGTDRIELIELANFLKMTSYLKNFERIKERDLLKFNLVKNKLPVSVRNLVFANQVCLKNVGTNEYLYLGGWEKKFLHSAQTRFVFSWRVTALTNQSVWYMELEKDNIYYINSKIYPEEYIFSAGMRKEILFNKDSRYALTWIPGGKLPESAWKIEPYGDECYIKNLVFNEYLYRLTYKNERDKGYLLSWLPSKIEHQNWRWLIEDCSEIR